MATDYHHMAKWALRFDRNGEGIAECDSRVVCIDLLDYASHPDGALMNTISHIDVNADNAVNLGHRAIENFKGGRPD